MGHLIRRRGEHVGRVDMLVMIAAAKRRSERSYLAPGVERANPLLDFAHFLTVFAGPRCRGSAATGNALNLCTS